MGYGERAPRPKTQSWQPAWQGFIPLALISAGLLAGRFTSGASLFVFFVGVWYAISPRAVRMLSAPRPSIAVQGLRSASVLALVSAGGIAYLDSGVPPSVAARPPVTSPRPTHDGLDTDVKPRALQPGSTTLTPPGTPGAVPIPPVPRILPPRRVLQTFDEIQEKFAARPSYRPWPKTPPHTRGPTLEAHSLKVWLLVVLTLTFVYTMGTIVAVSTGGSSVSDDSGKATHEHRCTHCHQPIDTADVPADGKPFDCPRCRRSTNGQWVTLD